MSARGEAVERVFEYMRVEGVTLDDLELIGHLENMADDLRVKPAEAFDRLMAKGFTLAGGGYIEHYWQATRDYVSDEAESIGLLHCDTCDDSGILVGVDSPEGVQRCDQCNLFEGDLHAAAALAAKYEGTVRYIGVDADEREPQILTWDGGDLPPGISIRNGTSPWVVLPDGTVLTDEYVKEEED